MLTTSFLPQQDIQVRGAAQDEKRIMMAQRYTYSRHYLTYQHSLRVPNAYFWPSCGSCSMSNMKVELHWVTVITQYCQSKKINHPIQERNWSHWREQILMNLVLRFLTPKDSGYVQFSSSLQNPSCWDCGESVFFGCHRFLTKMSIIWEVLKYISPRIFLICWDWS